MHWFGFASLGPANIVLTPRPNATTTTSAVNNVNALRIHASFRVMLEL
jgi:hypothetical protein